AHDHGQAVLVVQAAERVLEPANRHGKRRNAQVCLGLAATRREPSAIAAAGSVRSPCVGFASAGRESNTNASWKGRQLLFLGTSTSSRATSFPRRRSSA